MCLAVDAVFRRSVGLPFINIVESFFTLVRVKFPKVGSRSLLVSTVFVRIRRGPDHMSSARLADTLGDKSRKDSDVQDIAGVDEGARGRSRKLREARDGLLRGDKGAEDVDGCVAIEVG